MKTKVVVIAGWDRSGSTILANVLGSAPGVATLGEVSNVWERGFLADMMCGCGRPFGECEVWSAIAHRAFGSSGRDAAVRAKRSMGSLDGAWMLKRRFGLQGHRDDRAADRYAALLERLYTAAASATGAHVLVDSSKKPWHAAIALQVPAFEVYVLHLVRDPRGVAFSHRKRVRYDPESRQLMDQHPLIRSAASWVYRNQVISSSWRHEPWYVPLRYEDLVSAPHRELRRVFDRLGLDDVSAPLVDERTVRMGDVHNISGNPSRFERGDVQLRSDDAWRDGLSRRQQRWIQVVTWPFRLRYGY